MGNAEHKGRQQSATEARRSHFRRLFRRISPGTKSQDDLKHGQGSLIPCTNHNGECPVCLETSEVLLRFSVCSHMACVTCWLTFMCTEIESFAMGCLTCIACKERLAPSTVICMLTKACKDPAAYGANGSVGSSTRSVVKFEKALSRYEEFLLRQALAREPDMRWCPSGCGYGLIAHGFQACPQLVCPRPECYGRSFCYRCQRPWLSSSPSDSNEQPVSPGGTPQHVCSISRTNRNDTVEGIIAFLGLRQMRRLSSFPGDRSSGTRSKSTDATEIPVMAEDRENFNSSDEQSSGLGLSPSSLTPGRPSDGTHDEGIRRSSTSSHSSAIEGEVKACPNCKSLIQKLNDGTCNSMTCTVCSTDFCWLCMQPIGPGHFFSLTGCTVWGRRRLTRRRRIFILIGLLLGTPVLLSVLIALGVPLCTIILISASCAAVNNWSVTTKHRRRFWVFCTFLSSLIWAPLVTVLAALILVPLCLGYTYIYLPYSVLSTLCKESTTPTPLNPEQVTNYTAESA